MLARNGTYSQRGIALADSNIYLTTYDARVFTFGLATPIDQKKEG
jgi:hypothetical protein